MRADVESGRSDRPGRRCWRLFARRHVGRRRQGADHAANAEPRGRGPGDDDPHRQRRPGGHHRHADDAQGAAHRPRPGPAQSDGHSICHRAAMGRYARPAVPGSGFGNGAADHQPRRSRSAPGDARSGSSGNRRARTLRLRLGQPTGDRRIRRLACDRRRQPCRNPPLHGNRAVGRLGPSVGRALNRAANQVALDVAKWIGG